MTTIIEKVVGLASERFSEFTPAERRVLEAIATGQEAACGGDRGTRPDLPDTGERNPDSMIRADLLAWVATDDELDQLLSLKPIVIKYAIIEEELVLAGAQLKRVVRLEQCVIEKGIDLRDAVARTLSLTGTRCGRIIADRLNASGSVQLRHGFEASGEVRFVNASIGGDLSCEGGRFVPPNGIALRIEQSQIRGTVFLRKGFEARGEVSLINSNIGGDLDCEAGTFVKSNEVAIHADRLDVEGAVFLREGFRADGEVRFVTASIGGDFDCHAGRFVRAKEVAINAAQLHVGGRVFLNEGFQAEGEVRLINVSIGGNLDCHGGRFVKAKEVAINGAQLNVKGWILFNEGFQADGEVRLLNATTGGALDCSKGRFGQPQGTALNADHLHATGGVLLRDGFQAEGEVRLINASIGGDLDCGRGSFLKPGDVALRADRVDVKGAAFFREGFRAEGEVRISVSSIGRDLDCSGGVFVNPGKGALIAERINVQGSAFLRAGFHAQGNVRLNGSSIGVNLECQEAAFESLVDLLGVRVTCTLFWTNIEATQDTYVRLEQCTVGNFHDDFSWKAIPGLSLDGFTYDAILWPAPAQRRENWLTGIRDALFAPAPGRQREDRLTLTDRLEWLRRQDEKTFSMQPYEQLADVLAQAGHEADAKRVRIAQQDERLRHSRLGWGEKLWNKLLKMTIGYGYRTEYILIWSLLTVFIGMALFYLGDQNQLMEKIKDKDNEAIRLQPFIYSLDTFLPISSFHQEEYWMPRANDVWGSLLLCYFWVHIALGWILTTLGVAGLTGLVRKG